MSSPRILTLVFTDLEGSSELSETHGALFEAARDTHFALLREALTRFSGEEVETAGDSLFAVFADATSAAQWALEAQIALQNEKWPPQIGEIRVRVGAHRGEPFIGVDGEKTTYRGPVTNRAARVMGAAHGGQIIFSDAAKTAISADKTAFDATDGAVTWLDCGVHRLKGVGQERLWQLGHSKLRRDFPPLATLDPIRHNLPLPGTPLIGREGEIETWRELLLRERVRLLTLCALGGLGKTRAALALGETLVADFEGGVWWVDCAETRGEDALWAKIAGALGLAPHPSRPLDEQIINFLRPKTLVLALDNLEQNPDAAQCIQNLLEACPVLQILATSRHSLRLRSERVFSLPPLSLACAARLFRERANACGARLESSDDGAVDDLCRALEGVPLALELAASRAALLSPAQMIERLSQRFRLLQSNAPDLPSRQRTLQGTFDWSFELLPASQQQLFARLSPFAGGFFLEDAEAICDPDGDLDVLEGASELVRCSLLRVENEGTSHRFSMFESLRDYATRKRRESGETTVCERHAAHFAAFFERNLGFLRSEREVKALEDLECEADNARSAFDFALECAHGEILGKIALGLGAFLARRGLNFEAKIRLETALEKTDGISANLRSALWRELAGVHLGRGGAHLDDASRCIEMALESATNDEKGRALSLNVRGLVALKRSDFEAARRDFDSALKLFEANHEPNGAGIARHNLGTLAHRLGMASEAEAQWRAALDIRRARRDRRGLGESTLNLGVLAQESEDFEAADALYLEALEHERALGHVLGVALALFNLGEISQIEGKSERAWKCFGAAGALFGRAGSAYESAAFEARDEIKVANLERLAAEFYARAGGTADDLASWALSAR
ncbi:MAG TPA: adenylate/guanylate cyclase domain-containing protein [Abditibacterium sp.]|jgi:predicted ATPase/class 3 adenylate cyclase